MKKPLRELLDYLYNERYHSSELITRCEYSMQDKEYKHDKNVLQETIRCNIHNCQKMDKIIDMVIDVVQEKSKD